MQEDKDRSEFTKVVEAIQPVKCEVTLMFVRKSSLRLRHWHLLLEAAWNESKAWHQIRHVRALALALKVGTTSPRRILRSRPHLDIQLMRRTFNIHHIATCPSFQHR